MFRRIRIRTGSAISVRVTPLPSGGSQSVQRTASIPEPLEDMTVHHCYHNVTREPPYAFL